MSKWVDTNQLVKEFNVTRQTIYNWRQEGMPYHQLNHMVRFDPVEVMDWLVMKGGEKNKSHASDRH